MNEILEVSLRNAREHRDDMARWLAVEVLLNDPKALEDTVLEEHLYLLQDRIEQKLRSATASHSLRHGNGARSNLFSIAKTPFPVK